VRLTLQIKTQIRQALEGGVSFTGACRLAGVLPAQGQQWLNRAMRSWDLEDPGEDDLLYIDFATEILRAMGKFEEEQVEELLRDAEGDWRARAWLLERRYGKEWAQRTAAKVEVEVSGEVDVQHSGQVEVTAKDWATPERIEALAGMARELGLLEPLALEGGAPSSTADRQTENAIVLEAPSADRGEERAS
jgi:hypothetical protein